MVLKVVVVVVVVVVLVPKTLLRARSPLQAGVGGYNLGSYIFYFFFLLAAILYNRMG